MKQVTKTAKNYEGTGDDRKLVSQQEFKQWILDDSSEEMAEEELKTFVRKEYGTWRYVVYCFNRGYDLALRTSVREAAGGPMSKTTKRDIVQQFFLEDAGSSALGQKIALSMRGVKGKKARQQILENLYEANADELGKWWDER